MARASAPLKLGLCSQSEDVEEWAGAPGLGSPLPSASENSKQSHAQLYTSYIWKRVTITIIIKKKNGGLTMNTKTNFSVRSGIIENISVHPRACEIKGSNSCLLTAPTSCARSRVQTDRILCYQNLSVKILQYKEPRSMVHVSVNVYSCYL